MAINPSTWSVQKIVTLITAAGDWLRSAKLDTYKWSERYYQTAELVALSEKNGACLFKLLDELWPAGLKGHQVHYNGRPFDGVNLIPAEGLADCVIAPPMKNFKFDADKAWPEESDEVQIEHYETPKPKRARKAQRIAEIEEESEEFSDEDEQPKSFASQFKNTKKRRLN